MSSGTERIIRWTPLAVVGAVLAAVLASFLVSLSWGSDHGLTTGEEAARRGYALGLLVLGPLAMLTAFAAKHAGRTPAILVPWVSLSPRPVCG